MKILHTCDWHIGKIVNGFYMTEDQRFVLKQVLEIIKREKPDAVVIAGDIYDRGVPPVEAVELLNEVFSNIIIDLNTPILAIAGNHDSAERLDFASDILRNSGLYIESILKKDIKKITLHDRFGGVNFYLVPYAEPAVVRDVFNDNSIRNYDDAARAIVKRINEKIDTSERNVLVAHGYVVGQYNLETCDSERPLSIGGTESISADNFKDFDYVALGHLHGHQKVVNEKIRYSGSLLKYSFSEVRQKKCVTLIDMDENGDVSVKEEYLTPMRDMRIIKGRINDLLNPEVYKDTNVEDYIQVILTDEGEIIEPMNKLRSVYPNVMQLIRNDNIEEEDINTSAVDGYKKKSKLELFEEFYKTITGSEFTEDKREIMIDVIKNVEMEGRQY